MGVSKATQNSYALVYEDFQHYICYLVVVALSISLTNGGILRLAMIEFAIALVSAKLIYLMYMQTRANHFQMWLLS